MNKKIFFLSIALIGIFSISLPAHAQDISTRLKGRILLAVESNGEAWYVNPANSERYYLGRPADAYGLMKKLGLGISNSDFNSFKGKAPSRLAGRILIKVGDMGKAYYVNPVDLKLYFLGRPSDAFNLMRSLGLGINDINLSMIDVNPDFLRPNIEITKFDNLTISRIESTVDGWIVIHKVANDQPAEIVGHAKIKAGINNNVIVPLQGINMSQDLIAMQHYDRGKIGVFEYPGVDVPVLFNGQPVSKKFFYTYTVNIKL